MWSAALTPPRLRRILSAACVGLIASAVLGSGAAARSDVGKPSLPDELWAVLVTPRVAPTLDNAAGTRLRNAGVNTLIVNRRSFRTASYSRVTAFATRWKLTVISPVRSVSACRRQTICAVSAGTSTRAMELAYQRRVDVVVFGLKRPVDISGLRGGAPTARILAVATLGSKLTRTATWRSAVRTAHGLPTTDFAVIPKRRMADPALISYLSLLTRAKVASQAAGTAGPTAPAISPSPPTAPIESPTPGGGTTAKSAPAPITPPQPSPVTPAKTDSTNPPDSEPSPPQPGEAVANLWVDADGGTCTRNPSPSAYIDAAACSTMNAAYLAASLGDSVLMKATPYVLQTIDYDASKAGPGRVTFRAESGAAIAGIFFKGNHVAVENLTLTDVWYVFPGVHNILVKEVDGPGFYIRCGSDITVRGGEYTAPLATGVPTISSGGGVKIPATSATLCPSDAEPSRNILIDGTYFHEIFRPEGSSLHRECLHVMGVDGLTIRNAVFHKCLHFHISFKIHFGSVMRNVVVEDTKFDTVYGQVVGGVGSGSNPGLNFANSGTCEILVQRSTFVGGGLKNDCAPGGVGVRILANHFEVVPTCTSANQSTQYVWRNNTSDSGNWDAQCNLDSSNH